MERKYCLKSLFFKLSFSIINQVLVLPFKVHFHHPVTMPSHESVHISSSKSSRGPPLKSNIFRWKRSPTWAVEIGIIKLILFRVKKGEKMLLHRIWLEFSVVDSAKPFTQGDRVHWGNCLSTFPAGVQICGSNFVGEWFYFLIWKGE